MIRARRGARLAAITSGGAIPDLADYDVIEEPAGVFVGKVHEDFAVAQCLSGKLGDCFSRRFGHEELLGGGAGGIGDANGGAAPRAGGQ